MKVVYIAGKYRGPNPWAVEQNIRAAEEVAARVAALGLMPQVVHPMTRFIGGSNSDEQFWVDGTLEIMRRCDAVVLVPNWRDSVGARAEVEEAERLGIPVFGREPLDFEPNDTTLEWGLRMLHIWSEKSGPDAATFAGLPSST